MNFSDLKLPDISLPPMDASNAVLTVLAVFVAAILFFIIFKGLIRMILLALAIISAIGVWILIQRNGFTFVSFMTGSPQPWMVQVAAWGCALFVFMVFYHGMTWISQLFSWKRRVSPTGVLTTIFMSMLMLWLAAIGISYYGNVSRISYYHELALAQQKGLPSPGMPWFTRMKNTLRQAKYTAWLESIDPLDDPAQTNLACLVAYGCTLDEPAAHAFYAQSLATRGIPQPSRLLDLFSDKGMRTLVEERRFSTLLESERLKTILQFRDTDEHIRNIL